MFLWILSFWMVAEGSFCLCCPALAARWWNRLAGRTETAGSAATRRRWLVLGGMCECAAGLGLAWLLWWRDQSGG